MRQYLTPFGFPDSAQRYHTLLRSCLPNILGGGMGIEGSATEQGTQGPRAVPDRWPGGQDASHSIEEIGTTPLTLTRAV